MSLFDEIKVASDLEDAAIATLEAWFPVIIRELELQQSITRDALPLPRSFITADRLDKSNADQLPAIVVISPGMGGRSPRQEGDGTFRCFFALAVGVFVSSNNRGDTKRLVRYYTAIARKIMLARQDLGGYADGTSWLDESYDDAFGSTDEQTIGAGQTVFEVEVAGVVNRYGMPVAAPDPATQPGSDWELVQSATATIRVKED